MKNVRIIVSSVFLIFFSVSAFAQSEEIEDLWRKRLTTEVETENPVYRPVIGVSTGFLTFWGDVHKSGNAPLLGNSAFKLNLSGFIDKKRNFRWNVFWLNGDISGSYISPKEGGVNFKTNVNQFGGNIEYTFMSLFKRSKFHPFLSVGIAPINFSPMGDYKDGDGTEYVFKDGIATPELDGNYETNLNKLNKKKYKTTALTIPVDAGLDFMMHDRIGVRVGASYSFCFTDYIDNVGKDTKDDVMARFPNSDFKIDSKNDSYLYTYIALNFDLFSDPKSFKRVQLAMELETDLSLMMDQDGDDVLDQGDECPDTPEGVSVDEVGCPLDADSDGIPDYKDEEPNTPAGMIVNNHGAAITKSDFDVLDNQYGAIRREDVAALLSGKSVSRYKVKVDMPKKFESVDRNGDKEISYDELRSAVDEFLDNKSDFKTEDINELYEFFFAQ